MAEIRDELLYTEDHEWTRPDADDETILWIGVTDYAQSQLGDVVMVELPAVGDEISAGETFGTIESPKSVSDLVGPVNGEVIAVNGELEDSPELVNESPYEDGWLIKVRLSDASDLDALLDAEAYAALIEG